MNRPTLLLSLALAGCHAARPTSPAVRPPEAPALPAPSFDAPITTPGVRKAYYVGAINDPAHPELLYRPGVVFREEVPERWNRNAPGLRGAVTGVVGTVPDGALLPPASAEQQQLIAQQQQALQLLSEANDELRRGKPAVEEPVAAPPGPAPVPPRGLTAAPPAAVDLSRALVANAEGVIELSSEIIDAVDRAEPNPFVKRHQAGAAGRELAVDLTAISLGPRPTAVINGRLLNVGDPWEGFAVAAIHRDSVYLQHDRFVLQIVAGKGVTLRLPP